MRYIEKSNNTKIKVGRFRTVYVNIGGLSTTELIRLSKLIGQEGRWDNDAQWHEELGDKPKGWDRMPKNCYDACHEFLYPVNQKRIMRKIREEIDKELGKRLVNCAKDQHLIMLY